MNNFHLRVIFLILIRASEHTLIVKLRCLFNTLPSQPHPNHPCIFTVPAHLTSNICLPGNYRLLMTAHVNSVLTLSYVHWCFACLYACMEVPHSLELELQTAVSCHVGAENCGCLPQEQLELLTAEPSLLSLHSHFYIFHMCYFIIPIMLNSFLFLLRCLNQL